MTAVKNLLIREFSFDKIYDVLFLSLGLIIQIVVFAITESTWLSFISGITGIFSVVLCAQRKFSQFFFSFIQLFTYVVIAWEQKLYGEIIENAFYFVTMIAGLYLWKKNYNTEEHCISVKSLTATQNLYVCSATILGILIMALFLLRTNDTQPVLDSISTVPAFTAQILMMLKFKQNWWYWLTIDIAGILLWSNAGNSIMVAQYIFWSINCIYGLYKWNK